MSRKPLSVAESKELYYMVHGSSDYICYDSRYFSATKDLALNFMKSYSFVKSSYGIIYTSDPLETIQFKLSEPGGNTTVVRGRLYHNGVVLVVNKPYIVRLFIDKMTYEVFKFPAPVAQSGLVH